MTDQAQGDVSPTHDNQSPQQGSQSLAQELRIFLIVVLAAGAVFALLFPVKPSNTYGIFDERTRNFSCGSVVFPKGPFEERCSMAHTQRLGFAGLGLAGAFVLTAVALAKAGTSRTE